MSTELKAIKATRTSPAISVTRFAAQGGAKLQLTQGIGNALKGEAGFIAVNQKQAEALMISLAKFLNAE
jgi:hypothetical protein